MPNSYLLPGTPVVVGATPERQVEISGSGEFTVDGEKYTKPVVVDRAVELTGSGFVVTEEVTGVYRTPESGPNVLNPVAVPEKLVKRSTKRKVEKPKAETKTSAKKAVVKKPAAKGKKK